MTMPVTKHNFLVKDPPAEIPRTIKQAFHIASTGRPGVVLVDVTRDAQQATAEFEWPEGLDLPPGYRPDARPHHKQIREAASLILEAKRPVFLIGGGVIRGAASKEVTELVDISGAPFVTHPHGARCAARLPSATSACRACTVRSLRSPPCSERT